MMGKTSKRRISFYAIVDPKGRRSFAGMNADKPEFVPYGSPRAFSYDNERDAMLAVRDLLVEHTDDPAFPALEVRKMIRSDTVASAKRIPTNDTGVALLKKIREKYGRNSIIHRSVRWLLTREDWERWGFAVQLVDDEIDEEMLKQVCEQLTVDAVFVNPHVFTGTFKAAVALKLAFEGAAEIVELNG